MQVQMDRSRRYAGSPKSASPQTVEQFLQSDGPSNLPAAAATSPPTRRDYDQEEDHSPPSKKSVLAKVKEKAKKWKQTLVKKKPSNDENGTPAWGVNLDDEDLEEEDPEYLGAPMYESEMAPEGYKETARQHPRAVPVIPESHVLPSSAGGDDEQKDNKTKTITETVTEKLTPAYATVAEATQMIASKIQELTVSGGAAAAASSSTKTASASAGGGGGEQLQVFDKGVSVKEYLMNKLEPGEDEKALSQVISAAISPKKSPGEPSVVEKVREAVTMLLHNGEPEGTAASSAPPQTTSATVRCPKSSSSTLAAISTKPASVSPGNISISANSSASQPKSPLQQPLSSKSPHIPVSTNAYEVNLVEENHGRILQTN